MVGYVLLIVIVIGLSIAVFAFLKLYLPEERPKCPDDISLIIDTTCSNEEITITYTNKGLFSVDGALVRVGDIDRLAKELLNPDVFTFSEGPLEPGGSVSEIYEYFFSAGEPVTRELEIEPALFIDGEAVLCDGAIVSRLITCPAT